MKTTCLFLSACISALFFLPACSSKENIVPDKIEPDVTIPAVTYQGPLVITKGGKYTGNFRSADSKTPAIWVQTLEPVEITGCIIASAGDLIRCYGGTTVNIHHNSLYGITPTNNDQWGRALNDYQPLELKFENNLIEHSGGLLVDHADPNLKGVVIRYNIIRNTDRRKADDSPGENRSGIFFNTVLGIAGEISWNQFENLPGRSYVGDNINLFNSGGKSATPYLIHDNYIKGAYPYPLNAPEFVGSGITIAGDPGASTPDKMSQFINVYNNQVVSICNTGLNLSAGHDIHFYNNTVISSGRYPDGSKSERFWGGCCIWNASNVPATNFINNSIKDNTIGYARANKMNPYPGRQDWVVVNESPISVKRGENISLPGPITMDTERAELPKWKEKLSANKIIIGNAF